MANKQQQDAEAHLRAFVETRVAEYQGKYAKQLAEATEHNKRLNDAGDMPELPGQGISARSIVGKAFVILGVEYDQSAFADKEYARITCVFVDDPDQEYTVNAGGGYVLNQLHRMGPEVHEGLWKFRELLSLNGQPVKRFNGYYPLVLDYANRSDSSVVESEPAF